MSQCDLSRPKCSRCGRLNLHCEYTLLQKGDIFVHRTTQNPLKNTFDTSLKASGIRHREVVAFPGTHGKALLGGLDGRLMVSMPKCPNPVPAHLVQLFSSFIGLYLPKENQNPTVPGRTPASWVEVVAGFELNHPVFNSSLAALCTAHLGTWKKDDPLLNESIILYASALQKLRVSLKERIVNPKAILASIIMLSTYEVCTNQY
jgi:hypothetical protein